MTKKELIEIAKDSLKKLDILEKLILNMNKGGAT